MTAEALAVKISPASKHCPEDWRVIPDATVVTRNSDYSPASLFRDDSWNIAAYGRNNTRRNLWFRRLVAADAEPALATASKIQTKQVMYLLMCHASDETPAPATLKDQTCSLRDFVKFASLCQKTLYEAFEDAKTVLSYIRQHGYEVKSQRLHAILVHIHRLGVAKTGVVIPLRELHVSMLERYRQRPQSSQHPVIPTRIYQSFIAHCEMELSLFETAAEDLVQVIRGVYANQPLPTIPSSALGQVLTHFGRTLQAHSLMGLVTEIATLCEALVITFTGMRTQEAENLPFHCLNVFGQHGVEHYAIEGVTTKLTGGRVKRAFWVTSHLGVRAVRLAQKVLGEAHVRFGKPEYATSTDGTHLLFCRNGMLNSRYELGRGKGSRQSYVKALRQRAFTRITAEDVAELKLVDPFRAWDEEPEFSVGEIWPFTRHQLRRTLALYAQRSGLVTLPSLKRQLNHLTLEMSMYYARGSAFAQDVLATNKDHFAKEWAEAQGLSQYLSFASQVLFSDERMFGGHAAWAKSAAVKQSTVSVYSRAETLQMFERGQLAYKETVLGGCASTKVCESSPLNWLPLECLESDCKDMVLEPAKLLRVIKAQERHIEALEKMRADSVECRMEKEVLATLRRAEAKVCTPRGGRK